MTTSAMPVTSSGVGIWPQHDDADQRRGRGQKRQQQRELRAADLDEDKLIERVGDRGGQQSDAETEQPGPRIGEDGGVDGGLGDEDTGASTTAANDIPTASESSPSPVSATRLPSRM